MESTIAFNTRSDTGRLSTRSTCNILYDDAMNRSLCVVGRVGSTTSWHLIPASAISISTKSFKWSLPRTVEKDTSAPAAFRCLATTAAPPENVSVRSCLTLNVGDFTVAPNREQ